MCLLQEAHAGTAAAAFCLHAFAGKCCNGSGCGGFLLDGNGWRAVKADRLWLEEQPWSSPGRASWRR